MTPKPSTRLLAPLQGLKVLVLDDELHIRTLVQKVLQKEGCAVQTVANGREGLQSLLEKECDVLIVDIRMDGMDGPTFLREAHKIWPWLGVVVMTGNADPESVSALRALGVERILDKPLNLAALREAVGEEAARKQMRVEAGSAPSLERVQYQLGILRHSTETAVSATTLAEALRGLSDGLARLLACDAAGIYAVSGEEEAMIVTLQRPVAPSYVSQLHATLGAEYQALSGKSPDFGRLRVQTEGAPVADDGPQAPGTTLTVPVLASGELHGLLLVASQGKAEYTREEIAFLYHAASHLSTIFAALSRVRQMAIHDGLTGLYNRRRLDEEIEIAWERSRRYGHELAIAILDLDHFKQINDGHGHHVGDQVLRQFAELIRKSLRTSDVAGRYGGDELVVLLPDGGIEAGHAFGERILKAVRARVFGEPDVALHLTASIGVAHLEVQGPLKSGQELLQRADMALYNAKRSGRNQVSLWTPALEMSVASGLAPMETPPPEPPPDTTQGRILLVEDDLRVRKPMASLLRAEGFAVTTSGSVDEAIAELQAQPGSYSLVLTDLNMPGKSGMELLEALRDADDATVRVVITGHATVDNAVSCLRKGAFDFVEKPVGAEQLSMVVRRAMEHARLRRENQRYQETLEVKVEERSAALSLALQELENSYTFTLEALVAMLDAKEHATAQHSLRVSRITEMLARELGLAAEEVQQIATGAMLHDIGKISVPDRILLKDGPLTAEERAVMRGHPEAGFNILQGSRKLVRPAELVLSHHERWDGMGYPRGLRGEEICLGARIFGVVDAYDAMRSDRPYRRSMDPKSAVAQIREGCGTQFDPAIVELFEANLEAVERAGEWPNRAKDEHVA